MKQGVERFSLPCPPGRGSAQPPQFGTLASPERRKRKRSREYSKPQMVCPSGHLFQRRKCTICEGP